MNAVRGLIAAVMAQAALADGPGGKKMESLLSKREQGPAEFGAWYSGPQGRGMRRKRFFRRRAALGGKLPKTGMERRKR